MREYTLAITIGRWGGIYCYGGRHCWRLCLSFIAFTYAHAEFLALLDAWLTREGA